MDAWKRCRDLGLRPNSLKFLILTNEEVKQKLLENSQLIQVSKLYMDSLSLSLAGVPHVVALTDAEGWVIDLRGTPEEFGGSSSGLCLGASWSEENIGNNGIGTALVIGAPILVYGMEHFGVSYGGCACMGVPIICNGKTIGALNISVPDQYAHPARLHMAIACANSIESTILEFNKNTSNISSNSKLLVTNQLIATAVHDLKNPLSVIRGLGQLGNRTSDISLVQDYFSRIISQVDKMNNMLIELLDVFRPEELIPNKVVNIIEEVLYEYEPICTSKNIRLSLINNTDQSINMCPRLFKRTIENLIKNSVGAMGDDGGIIEIITELDEDSIIITVNDNAGGIPEEIRETLFDPFSTKGVGGTGLGLFMAYHTITNTHNGQIWFETKLGIGTTFFIKLPIMQQVSFIK